MVGTERDTALLKCSPALSCNPSPSLFPAWDLGTALAKEGWWEDESLCPPQRASRGSPPAFTTACREWVSGSEPQGTQERSRNFLEVGDSRWVHWFQAQQSCLGQRNEDCPWLYLCMDVQAQWGQRVTDSKLYALVILCPLPLPKNHNQGDENQLLDKLAGNWKK